MRLSLASYEVPCAQSESSICHLDPALPFFALSPSLLPS